MLFFALSSLNLVAQQLYMPRDVKIAYRRNERSPDGKTGKNYWQTNLLSGSVLVRYVPDSNYQGKTVAAIAQMRNETAAQTLLYLIAAASAYSKLHAGQGGVEAIMGKSMAEADVSSLIVWPHTNICSDGANGGHPRGYGTFTRILERYVKEKNLLSWEQAINKMTGLAAEHTGIKNRGIIAPGFFADLVLIDPLTVKDNADIKNPVALSDGILKVWVNGVLVYKNKATQQKYPGVFIER